MGEKLVLQRTSEANLDTQSSDISAEETSESERSFQSLIVCGKKLLLYASLLAEGSKALNVYLINSHVRIW